MLMVLTYIHSSRKLQMFSAPFVTAYLTQWTSTIGMFVSMSQLRRT